MYATSVVKGMSPKEGEPSRTVVEVMDTLAGASAEVETAIKLHEELAL
jgi:hypothetical protein